ncbi:UDP-4-amino-4,6-dideoxy-N-acetyl-beta-L-altrosamine N-acetyltransferase [Sulfurimonas sp.]|nr:UDP-4-amino-4,6-dideoxy-N-acetyl-beta-L-altrosamine N-acetyltransferase [Sulfurimonas sp.]
MSSESVVLRPFFDLSDEEKEMILIWRNDDNVRKWMHTSGLILMENHFKFIENLKNDKSNEYFLVQQNEIYLGVIYFSNINILKKTCEFGLYANISLKGVGKILLNKICEYSYESLGINTLYAEVYKKNKKAISLYERAGFKNSYLEIKNMREIIHMELKSENR